MVDASLLFPCFKASTKYPPAKPACLGIGKACGKASGSRKLGTLETQTPMWLLRGLHKHKVVLTSDTQHLGVPPGSEFVSIDAITRPRAMAKVGTKAGTGWPAQFRLCP